MSYNILVVDDSMLTRAAIKRMLGMVDLDVGEISEAGNGLEALQILEDKPIDLILADLNMPEMGGVELVQHVQEKPELAGIPIIIISTESSTARVEDLLEHGVKNFLHKPFTPEEFRSTIVKNLEVFDGKC